MKKNYTIILSLAISLCLIAAYVYVVKNDTKKREVKSPVKVEQQALANEKKITDKNDFYDIEATYPVEALDKNSVLENFVTSKVEEKKEQWKVGGEAYNEEKKIEKDFPDRPKMQYQYFISYKKYESKKWGTVSYAFTIYEFTGGANGNMTVTTFNFDGQGLVLIDNILDLSTNNNDIAVTKILRDKLLTRENASSDMINEGLGLAYLKADGKTLDQKKCNCDGFFFPSNFQNFIVEDDGLRLIFNKYQVAPGSDGLPEVVLTYDSLKEYLLAPFK